MQERNQNLIILKSIRTEKRRDVFKEKKNYVKDLRELEINTDIKPI